jgi:hypothetical protein
MEFEYKIALIDLASLPPDQAPELKPPEGKGWKLHFAFNMGGDVSCLIWGRKKEQHGDGFFTFGH